MCSNFLPYRHVILETSILQISGFWLEAAWNCGRWQVEDPVNFSSRDICFSLLIINIIRANKKKERKKRNWTIPSESARNNEREPAGWDPLDQHTVQREWVDSLISTHNYSSNLNLSFWFCKHGRVQIDDSKNDDVPDDGSSPVQRDSGMTLVAV